MKKRIIIILATVLICFGAAGTSFALLIAETEPVINTFTIGDIVIRLSESTPRNNKLIPGTYLEENPRVTVKAGSEDCWLFIKVEKSDNFDTFLDFSLEDEWLALEDNEGVYYREVDSSSEDQGFVILSYDRHDDSNEDKVPDILHVKSTPTKEQLSSLTEETYPSLAFTAYAVQKVGFDTPLYAWNEVKDLEYVHGTNLGEGGQKI